MRWLKIVYRLSRAGRPILLSASILGACSRGSVRTVPNRDAAVDAIPGIVFPDATIDRRDSADAGILPNQDAKVIVIGMPDATLEPGHPVVPSPDAAPATLPLECIDIDGGADTGITALLAEPARVTMDWVRESGQVNPLASVGHITIAREIAGRVVGLPTVEIVAQVTHGRTQPTISNIRADGGGFAFDVAWSEPGPDDGCMDYAWEPAWTFRTTLRLQCGGQERSVDSFTVVTLCGWTPPKRWASSGESCDICANVCEMAPSPIVPDVCGDDLPLASALNVTLRPLARVGGTVVLWADHAPREGLGYAWQTTAGTLEQLDRDVVLWRPSLSAPTSEQLVQVAITGQHLAAVAGFRPEWPAA
jgi:hypothetical protein